MPRRATPATESVPVPSNPLAADHRCERCGRPHGFTLRCLPDGRWLSPDGQWLGADGTPAPWPDVVEYARVRTSRAVIGLYRLRHAAAVSAASAAPVSAAPAAAGNAVTKVEPMERRRLCRRCHIITGRGEHRRVARMRVLMRFALGDLFEGAYRT